MMKRWIAAMLALALALALTACKNDSPAPAAQPGSSAPTQNPPSDSAQSASPADTSLDTQSAAPTETDVPVTEEPIPDPTVPALPSEPDELLDELYSLEGSYTDQSGNEYTYSYFLPQITADAPGARRINGEINERFGSEILLAQDTMERGQSLGVVSVSWYPTVWNNILSLVVIESLNSSFRDYAVYHYDVATGQKLTGREVLARMDIAEDQFLSATRECVDSLFAELYSDPSAEGYDGARERSLSTDYINADMMFLPSWEGELIVVAPVAALDGTHFYYYEIIPTIAVG